MTVQQLAEIVEMARTHMLLTCTENKASAEDENEVGECIIFNGVTLHMETSTQVTNPARMRLQQPTMYVVGHEVFYSGSRDEPPSSDWVEDYRSPDVAKAIGHMFQLIVSADIANVLEADFLAKAHAESEDFPE